MATFEATRVALRELKMCNEWVDIVDVLSGQNDHGLSRYMLSPFTKILSEEEANNSIMRYVELDEPKKIEIHADFISFFSWFGCGYLPLKLVLGDHTPYRFERIDVEPSIVSENLCRYVMDFLTEENLFSCFHTRRNAFVVFNFDMTAFIIGRDIPKNFPKMKHLKFIPLL